MNRMPNPICMLLIIATLIPGCQTLQERNLQSSLNSTLSAYAATLRWGHPGQTVAFLNPSAATDTAEDKSLNNIRVTSYKVLRPPVLTSEDQAQQTAAIQYVLIDEQIEKTLIDHQIWKYEKETKKWTRLNSIPAFN